MRRAALMLAVLSLWFPTQARDQGPHDARLVIKAEYRQDALDYDDTEVRFVRDSATVTFGKNSANFTHVHISDKKENRFTWYIDMRGISPYFECILGNFYLNFGAGLAVGRKRADVPDAFARSTIVSDSAPFSPCRAGSPLYAFRGIAAGPVTSFDRLSISLTGFCSFRTRFVRNDIHLRDATGSSFNAILQRRRKDYRYSEPAEISDSGCMALMRICGRLTLQAYFIRTTISRACAGRLLWDYGDRGLPEAAKVAYAYGIFARYRDRAIEIFIEVARPNTVSATAARQRRRISDIGLLCGLKFTHQGCTLSFTGKHCGSNFYAPYAAGNSRAESSFKADFGVRPARRLTLGCGCFAEKKIAATGYERYRPSSIREDAFLRYRVPGKGSFSAAFSHLEEDGTHGRQRSLQLKSSAELFIMGSIRIRAGGSLRRKGGSRYSGSIRSGLTLCMLRYFRIDLRYARYYIAPGNPVYTSRTAFRDSMTRMSSIDSTSDSIACRISTRCSWLRLSLNYEHRFSGARSIRSRIEAAATILIE